jgi:cytosine/adenosine deaminase-related metal-dependent hydrolase
VVYLPNGAPPRRAYYELSPAEDQDVRARLERTQGHPDRQILFRGACVISMDAGVGDFAVGDLLVSGDRIAAVCSDLAESARDPDVIVIEAGGMILIPGLCDAHRHCWQNQFRRSLSDVSDLDVYRASTHGGLALHYRPEDHYAGNLVSALGAIDSGVTCLLDFSHNSRSPSHSDAALQALRDAGIRAVHASGPPNEGPWDHQWPGDLRRVRKQLATSPDRLVTLRMGIDQQPRPSRELVDFARDLGLGVTIDGVIGPRSSAEILELAATGSLGPDLTLIHCTDLSDQAWSAIAESGTCVCLAPTSDQQIGIADGLPPIEQALAHGIRPGISVDVEISLSGDLFSQMRSVLTTQRMFAAARHYHGHAADRRMISTRDVLDFGTVQGARCNGLLDEVGTLTPGKAADIVAIRAEDINNMPLNSAVGTVVLGCDARNVDTVLTGGTVRKWRGELLGHDIGGVRELVRESRARVAARYGIDLDVLGSADGWA